MEFIGAQVPDDVATIVKEALKRDPELNKSIFLRTVIREWADRNGIAVAACPA